MAESATDFAPAERADTSDLKRHIEIVSHIPRLGELLDTVGDIVLVLNAHRQIVYASKAVEEALDLKRPSDIYGLRPGEALGCQHAHETTGGCGTTRFCVECGAVKSALDGLRGRKSVEECHLLRQQGDALDLRVTSTPFTFSDEPFAVFVVTDVSHEKRLQVLEHTFLHDVSNRLTVLHGLAEFVSATIHSSDANLIEDLKAAIQQTADEINGHKELLAAENGELTLHPAPLSSLSILRELVSLHRHLDIAHTKPIDIFPASADVQFTTDKTQLARILGNMLKNALEASWPGDHIVAGCELGGDKPLSFWVKNPQVMRPEVQLQVFNRSFSTKGQGRGVGTYSIKLLGERYLQGKTSFTSTPGQGTIFRISLPLTLS
ncbi:MAG TPA: HAMP domain-containing sensor histidine kinase [Verrucomicrobiae bacterium]|nr:HAMP domain-containing sensor histidine kinase [Verrucomicrobiae bacterium]